MTEYHGRAGLLLHEMMHWLDDGIDGNHSEYGGLRRPLSNEKDSDTDAPDSRRLAPQGQWSKRARLYIDSNLMVIGQCSYSNNLQRGQLPPLCRTLLHAAYRVCA